MFPSFKISKRNKRHLYFLLTDNILLKLNNDKMSANVLKTRILHLDYKRLEFRLAKQYHEVQFRNQTTYSFTYLSSTTFAFI